MLYIRELVDLNSEEGEILVKCAGISLQTGWYPENESHRIHDEVKGNVELLEATDNYNTNNKRVIWKNR